jgi:hypothetical protein
MSLKKSNIYLFIMLGCLIGYTWLYWNISNQLKPCNNATGICLIKNATSFPCPSCGTTRSLISIFQGDFFQALHWNPLGFFLLLLLITLPLGVIYDYYTKKTVLLRIYMKAESWLRQKKIAIPGIILILLNWYWNIQKDL